MFRKLAGSIMLAAALMAVPAMASETEDMTVLSEETEMEAYTKVSTEMEDGVLTIRIEEPEGEADPDFWWEAYNSDKGDASVVELLTQSTDDGCAYAGSFRAIDDGDDVIRLVNTNGHYVKEYMDFNVTASDGKIQELTGGSQGYETTAETLAPILEGVWEEFDGAGRFMEISAAPDGGLSFVISDGSGRDGSTTIYTMTAYYDAVKEALVYWDGQEQTAAIETEISAEPAEGEEQAAGEGTGLFAIELQEDDSFGILWKDDTFGNTDAGTFFKTAL